MKRLTVIGCGMLALAWVSFLSVKLHSEDTTNQVTPLPHAHAHNDYKHPRPFQDALERGFCSIEADVFLQNGELLVGHELKELRSDRTLEGLYLAPLENRIRQQQGHVYSAQTRFYLLIDIKSEGNATYEAIHTALAAHAHLLSSWEQNVWTPRAITVVISGNVPHEMMLKQSVRYAGIDGRPHDLKSTLPVHAMPWISANWKPLFRWRGEGPMPPAEQEKLEKYVADAHAAGRLVRFWATPENPSLWQELRRQNVDLIGTDDLPKLQSVFKSQK